MNAEDKQLIDRYLDNELTGLELEEFLNRIEKNDAFKKQVSFQNLLVDGIRHTEDKRLQKFIEKSLNYRKPKIPLELKLIATFLIITISGILLWDYIGPGSSGPKRIFSMRFFEDKNKAGEPVSKTVPNNVLKHIPEEPVSESKSELDEKSNDTNSAGNVNDIVVRKDQFLISYSLKPIEVAGKDSSNDNQSKNTIEKLNPEAGLPEENEKIQNYNVEFWLSPVNYRGYKLSHERLILFGIEEPDEVKLFAAGNKLWMKYGNSFYDIETNDNFESFVQASQIPTSIK